MHVPPTAIPFSNYCRSQGSARRCLQQLPLAPGAMLECASLQEWVSDPIPSFGDPSHALKTVVGCCCLAGHQSGGGMYCN